MELNKLPETFSDHHPSFPQPPQFKTTCTPDSVERMTVTMELEKLPHPLISDHHLTAPPQFETSFSRDSVEAKREMIFQSAALQPVQIDIDQESMKPPKRRNVKISKDPLIVAARHQRERISERIRILQRLVPGGMKMDTATMLDEAAHYMKFLKKQVHSLGQTTHFPGFKHTSLL